MKLLMFQFHTVLGTSIMAYIHLFLLDGLLSESSVCLTWSLHDNILKFRCQTTKMNARISFFDQYNHEQAYCVLPYQSTYCISYNNERNIYQNLSSKETFLEISDRIGTHLNGEWSCHYGRNLAIGYVDVKIVEDKGNLFLD